MDASEEGEVRAGTCFCNLFIFLGNVAWLKPENLSQPTGVGGGGKREESILGKEPARNSAQCGILFVLVLKKQKAIPVIFFKKQQKKFF